jgi:hypothetical protein
MSTYGNVAQSAGQPTSSATNLAGMASGADAGKDPYMMQMLQDNANLIGNRVASQMSGNGRLGSFGYGDAMARSITAANAPILSNAYNSDKNRQLSASGQIDQSNNAANAMQLGAAQGQTNALNFGQQNAAQWASMLPQLQQASYAPGQMMLGIGGCRTSTISRTSTRSASCSSSSRRCRGRSSRATPARCRGLSPLMANAGSMTGTQDMQKQLGFQDYANMFAGGGNSAAAGGANAASALLGLFSDRTEKTDIKKLGPDPETGVMMYAYRYRDDPKSYPKVVGPMAQDLEKMLPGSTERVGGKLIVKREALGILGL